MVLRDNLIDSWLSGVSLRGDIVAMFPYCQKETSMEKMLINMNTIDDVQKIVNAARKLDCRVDLTDGAHLVDAKQLAGVITLNPAMKITVIIHGDHEDYRNLSMWLKDLYIGKVVDIMADTPQAEYIMELLGNQTTE